mmetsp:Transcript_8500/g.25074  ORF Transcript_8500/g.25074 Transcript_8500/m.25074 type:complete len:206 (-) Transcript_8500:8-625(-)
MLRCTCRPGPSSVSERDLAKGGRGASAGGTGRGISSRRSRARSSAAAASELPLSERAGGRQLERAPAAVLPRGQAVALRSQVSIIRPRSSRLSSSSEAASPLEEVGVSRLLEIPEAESQKAGTEDLYAAWPKVSARSSTGMVQSLPEDCRSSSCCSTLSRTTFSSPASPAPPLLPLLLPLAPGLPTGSSSTARAALSKARQKYGK